MIQLTKKLSQVFLKDTRYIKRIIEAMPLSQHTIVEIGPGSGRMSEHIIPLVKNFYGIEFDQRLYLFLKDKFSCYDNADFIHSDIRDYRLPAGEKPLIVFGNIPYAISKDIVNYLTANRIIIEQAYLTCQKEFVDKLCARPGGEGYGYLSCFIQYYADVEKLFDIPASAFSPKPKVDSSFVVIKFYSSTEFGDDDEKFLSFMKNIFRYPRKQIGAILRGVDGLTDKLQRCGIDQKSRPADITLAQYVALYRVINFL